MWLILRLPDGKGWINQRRGGVPSTLWLAKTIVMKRALCWLFFLWLITGCNTSLTAMPTLTSFGSVSIPNATVVYYDISGSTEDQLRDQLNTFGPVGYDGHKGDATTQWHITWQWPGRANGSCRLSEAVVSHQITVILPKWNPPPSASSKLIAKWETYLLALAEHEAGHVSLVIANLQRVEETIKGATCETANAAGEARLSEIRKADVDYDTVTDHGATQGARFP